MGGLLLELKYTACLGFKTVEVETSQKWAIFDSGVNTG